ncbi:MAG: hypothetical protein WED04_10715 [Promethearchaeati archaeon SRVP18_Atabeyarchaeia-1]
MSCHWAVLRVMLSLAANAVKIRSLNVGQVVFMQRVSQLSEMLFVERKYFDTFKKLCAIAITLEQRQLSDDRKVYLE